jgi:hypothetical protein
MATLEPVALWDFENNLNDTGALPADNLTAGGTAGAIGFNADSKTGSKSGQFTYTGTTTMNYGKATLSDYSAWTFAMWVKPTTVTDNYFFTGGYNAGTDVATRNIEFRRTGQELLVYVGTSLKGDTRTVPTGYQLATNEWVHAAFTLDETITDPLMSNWAFYVNGVKLQEGLTANKIGSSTLGTEFYVGARKYSNGTAGMTGYLDDVRIYDRALSGTEISNVYTGIPEPATIAFLGLGLISFLRKK